MPHTHMLASFPRTRPGNVATHVLSLFPGRTHCENTVSYLIQVFISHSEPISCVEFSLDSRRVISCGDAIFIWDFMARQGCKTVPSSSPPSTPPPSSQHPPISFTSASPRKRAPTPVDYEPLKMHSFTPLAPTPRQKDKGMGY